MDEVESLTLPGPLYVDLSRGGITYKPVGDSGRTVKLGDALAQAPVPGGVLSLPAPASGQVTLDPASGRVVLEPSSSEEQPRPFAPLDLTRATATSIKSSLSRAGIWPMFWSSRSGGLAPLGDDEGPRAIIVNCILTEPFRARGSVVIARSWERIVAGIRFLQRLAAEYGRIEIVLTAPEHPLARKMSADLSGYAWVRLHAAPLVYPIENPRILTRTLRSTVGGLRPQDEVWVIDVQGVEAVGACLSGGQPLHRRIAAVGGPALAAAGMPAARHVDVRVGTPIRSFLPVDQASVRVLRGGLLTGLPVDHETAAVQYDDDAFFALAEPAHRETLSFLRGGLTRTSYSGTFVSRLTGAADSHITTSLRGERRPCIACGLCEEVCPAGIMPQVLHRALYRGALDEAEKAGLDLCVDCNLCTYVCPSKIELQKQFSEARAQIGREREEASSVEAAASTSA